MYRIKCQTHKYKEGIILKTSVGCRHYVYGCTLGSLVLTPWRVILTSPQFNTSISCKYHVRMNMHQCMPLSSHAPRCDSIPHLIPIPNLTSPHFNPSHLLPNIMYAWTWINACHSRHTPTGPRHEFILHLILNLTSPHFKTSHLQPLSCTHEHVPTHVAPIARNPPLHYKK